MSTSRLNPQEKNGIPVLLPNNMNAKELISMELSHKGQRALLDSTLGAMDRGAIIDDLCIRYDEAKSSGNIGLAQWYFDALKEEMMREALNLKVKTETKREETIA